MNEKWEQLKKEIMKSVKEKICLGNRKCAKKFRITNDVIEKTKGKGFIHMNDNNS